MAGAEPEGPSIGEPSAPDAPGTVVACALCGKTESEPPITWMFEVDPRRGGLWYCATCARENLRSVEAKLSPEWW